MATTLTERPMAAKKQSRTATARLDAEIIRKANIIAAFRGVSTPDYLTSLVGPLVDRDFEQEVERASKRKDRPK